MKKVHQPVVPTSPAGRSEVISRPTVGMVHTTVRRMTNSEAIGLLNDCRIALTAVTAPAGAAALVVAWTLIRCRAPFGVGLGCSRRGEAPQRRGSRPARRLGRC